MSDSIEKACFVCGRVLPLEDFYRHSEMADGHLNKCKSCCKEQAHGYRRARLDHWRECDRQRAKTPKRKASFIEQQRKSRQQYPEKDKARRMVRAAVKAGELRPQPCVVCGDARTEAHHPDYSKPLQIVWVCRSCHFKIHYGGLVIPTY